jgi:hypothetical protein
MDRINATERPTASKGATYTYDVNDVWKDGHGYSGVVHASWGIVVLADWRDGPQKVRVWMPGEPVKEITLRFEDKFAEPFAAYGRFSVDAVDDVPLDVFWVVTPGKAG